MARPAPRALLRSATNLAPRPASAPSRPTVLVATADILTRSLLAITLSSGLSPVLEASDGATARELLRLHRPCAALLDVHLPLRSGVELTRELRRDPALRGTGVLLLGRDGDTDALAEGVAAGAAGTVDVPFSPLQVLQRVGRLLGTPVREVGADWRAV